MGRAILLCGEDARTPYRFVSPDVQVYTIEELCYVLKENAFLLENDILDKRLADWIGGECGLKELAAQLYPLVNQRGTVSAFVLTILEYVGNYDRPALQEVEHLLKQGANLSTYEKYKSRVDYMAGKGRFMEAAAEYEALLNSLPEAEKDLRARILHNKGVAYANMFLFEDAADCFWKSYELCPEQETFTEYLAAKRMQQSDEEYVSFVAELPEAYEISLELEKCVEALRRSWENHIDKKRLEQMKQWKADGESSRYYEEIDRAVQGLKHSYRLGTGDI